MRKIFRKRFLPAVQIRGETQQQGKWRKCSPHRHLSALIWNLWCCGVGGTFIQQILVLDEAFHHQSFYTLFFKEKVVRRQQLRP